MVKNISQKVTDNNSGEMDQESFYLQVTVYADTHSGIEERS
jgi:hypothetical protein